MRLTPQSRQPSLRVVVTGLALAFATATLVHANGTIDTSNSTVAAGTAATPGTVTIEPCAVPGPAPALPSIGTIGGTIGTMTGAMPPFPGGGSGADGAFHATGNVELPGGTYEYTTYRVDADVRLDYSGAVTIRTTGDVVIDGHVVANAGHVIFECGGDLTVRANSGFGAPGIHTFGGLVKLDVAGALRFVDISTFPNQATSAFGTLGTGDFDFIGRGGPDGAAMDLGRFNLGGAEVRMRSATSLRVQGGVSTFGHNAAIVHAFGGDITIENSSFDAYGSISVEASGGVRTSLTSFLARGSDGVNSWVSDASFTAFGGPIVVTGGSIHRYDGIGDIRMKASTGAELRDNAMVQVLDNAGALEVTAFGGDLKLEAGLGTAVRVNNLGTGAVSLSASGAMSVTGNSAVKAANGDLNVRAFAGAFTATGTVTLETVLAGAIDLGASGDVTATAGGDIHIKGDSVRVVGNRVDLASELLARTGAITLNARAALAGTGTMAAATQFSATSIEGDITLDNSSITTASDLGARSGDILLTTFAGATAGRIAARPGIISTGGNATESGDITMRVVTVPRATVSSYLLPASVSVKLGTVKGAGLRADGTLGCPAAWLTPGAPAAVPFAFDVGTRHIAGDLALRSNGKDREFKAPGVLLRVLPSKSGTSEGVFSLRLDEDLTGKVPADGLVVFRMLLNGTDFEGTVRLASGKFKLGSTRGAVSELLYPLAVAAQLKDGGKDTLALTVGFASDGVTPGTMSDLGIDFGDTFSVEIAAEDFVKSKDKFTAKNPPSAPGITLVVVDFAKETVQVKGKSLTLGAFGHNPTSASARIGVAFGGDIRSVEVTLAKKGTKLTY